MKQFVLSMLEKIVRSRLVEIPITSIRLERRQVYLDEGWGGKTIDYFPPCRFFKMSVEGGRTRAVEAMERWYYNRLIEKKLHTAPKKTGGMQNGSLYRLIEKLHRIKGIALEGDLSNADKRIIEGAIKLRVKDRFALLDSIKTSGYSCCWDCIRVKKQGEFYVLIQGYHRLAALVACGHSSVMAAVSNPLSLRAARRLARWLLKKSEDYHCRETEALESINCSKNHKY